jgi:site-specific recombinase XerD
VRSAYRPSLGTVRSTPVKERSNSLFYMLPIPAPPLCLNTDYAYMDIRFSLRRSKARNTPGTVYCTVAKNGERSTPFSTGIMAWPPPASGAKHTKSRQWQLWPVMRLYGDTPEVRADNKTLGGLYALLHRIHDELVEEQGDGVTANDVTAALRRKKEQVPTLAEAAALFLAAAKLKVRPAGTPIWERAGYAPSTLSKFSSRLGLLTEYLGSINTPGLPLEKFTAKHADGLVQLIQHRPDAKPGRKAGRGRGIGQEAYAGKVVGLIKQVLDYAVNQEWLAFNPLNSYTAPRGGQKPFVYLLPTQVEQLEAYSFASPYLQRCADLFLFSCWTGLAWTDLMAFDASQHLADGWLTMYRHKTGTAFSLPLLAGAQRLLDRYGEQGIPRYQNQPLNRMLKQIAALLGWDLELTTHVGRRTFGMFLLNESVPIETVSAVLGHRSIRTTQAHYARFILREKMERDLGKLRGK